MKAECGEGREGKKKRKGVRQRERGGEAERGRRRTVVTGPLELESSAA